MSAPETPKKAVPKGRWPKAEVVSDFCRLCKCPFKLKFGNFDKTSYVSSKRLFKAPTTSRKDYSEIEKDKTLFQFLTALNIRVERVPELSDRVCKSCARKYETRVACLRGYILQSTCPDRVQNQRSPERNVSYQ